MKPLYICIIILIIQYSIQPPKLHRYTLSNLQFDNRRHPMQPWPNLFQPACNSIQPSSGNVATIVILGTKLSATIVTWSALFWWPVQRILNWRIRDTASIFPCVAFIYSIYHWNLITTWESRKRWCTYRSERAACRHFDDGYTCNPRPVPPGDVQIMREKIFSWWWRHWWRHSVTTKSAFYIHV